MMGWMTMIYHVSTMAHYMDQLGIFMTYPVNYSHGELVNPNIPLGVIKCGWLGNPRTNHGGSIAGRNIEQNVGFSCQRSEASV